MTLVKAAVVIEQVGANALKVSNTLPSHIEAPSRPAPRPAAREILLEVCAVVKLLIMFKNLVPVNLFRVLIILIHLREL